MSFIGACIVGAVCFIGTLHLATELECAAAKCPDGTEWLLAADHHLSPGHPTRNHVGYSKRTLLGEWDNFCVVDGLPFAAGNCGQLLQLPLL